MDSVAPKLSVVTRTRDRHALLQRALESVLGQTLQDLEHVIVNDGGNAAALDEFLKPYEARYAGRLKVVHQQTPQGMQQSANAGVAAARGEYVALHDDDDSWHPEFCAACTAFLDEQGSQGRYRGVVTQTLRVWESIDSTGAIVERERENYMPLDEISLFRVGFENPFPPISFVYRRSVHEELGGYDPSFDVAGDMDFNIRFLDRYEIGVIPRKLAYYHWRRDSADTTLHNSVTLGSSNHGRRLNELLNHYLRNDASRLGLALNMARYAVGVQGRLDRMLERLADTKLAMTDGQQELKGVFERIASERTDQLLERLADLKLFTGDGQRELKGVFERIASERTEQLLERLGDLKLFTGDSMADFRREVVERLADIRAQQQHRTREVEAVETITRIVQEMRPMLDKTVGKQDAIATELAGRRRRVFDFRLGPLRLFWEKKSK